MRSLASSFALSLVPLLVAPPLAAQHRLDAPAAFKTVSTNLDSGYVDGAADGRHAAVVFRGVVRTQPAPWLRLQFETTNLPHGSRLRLVAARDGAVQHFDAWSLRDYGHRSAYFNGNEVTVELLAAPGSRGNRVRVVAAEVGLPSTAAEPESICGTDDRQPSTDARIGRQHPSTCSVWLINEYTVLTAGHCASATQSVHFNVPLSTSSGGRVMPPPEDQYPYDGATLRRQNVTVGADWAVVATVRNSNTGLYPGQAQGAWFALASPPPLGTTVRVTGYGSVSGSVPRAWNYAQKTDTGAFHRLRSTYGQSMVDVTGGNSGSPVIREDTGEAFGITTHCPCPGYAMRTDVAVVQNAIAAVVASKVLGSFTTYGAGCAGSNGTPSLGAAGGDPTVGATFDVTVDGLAPNQPGALLFGVSNTAWAGGPLPRDLTAVGMTGCAQLHDWAAGSISLGTGPSGSITQPVAIPAAPALVGTSAFVQFAALDPTANPFGAVTSDAAEIGIGRD